MKKFKALVLIIAMVMMTSSLSSCATEVEAAEFTGRLNVANGDRLVISNATGTKEFVTDENTRYDMGGESVFCVSDIVDVSYHSKGRKMIVDEMKLKKHVHQDLVFDGVVTDLGDKTITVNGKSLTVVFSYNSETSISGKPSKGDEVSIVYTGDLSEYPKADKITVTKENDTPETLSASGLVSEFTGGVLQLAIDSAHSMKFKVDNSTKVTGNDTEIKVGQTVKVTYPSGEETLPPASEVNIIKKAEPHMRTLNGTVTKYKKDSISIRTSKKEYSFTIDKNTKFKGVNPEVGYESEVTYNGDWEGKPVASSIYTAKHRDDPAPAPEPTPTPTPTPTPVPPTPAPTPITAQGTLNAWGIDGTNKCTVNIPGTGDITLSYDPATLEIMPGYLPQAGDNVNIIYTASDMVLNRIDLISRPEQPVEGKAVLTGWSIDGENRCTLKLDGTNEIGLIYDPAALVIPAGYFPQVNDEVAILYLPDSLILLQIELKNRPEPEEKAEPVPVPEQPEQPTEPEKPAEPEQPTEPEKPAEAEPPAVTDKPAEPVAIKSDGKIISSDESAKTMEIELASGEKIKLNMDGDTNVSSGFFPQAGDEVKIVYIKDDMLLKDIQITGRAEQ